MIWSKFNMQSDELLEEVLEDLERYFENIDNF